MNNLQLLVGLLGSAGFVAGIAAIIKNVLDHKRGVTSDEVAAEERHIHRLEESLTKYQKDVDDMREKYNLILDEYKLGFYENASLNRYINILTKHIEDGKGPPPEKID